MIRFNQYVEQIQSTKLINSFVENAQALGREEELINEMAKLIIESSSDPHVKNKVEIILEAGFFQGLGNLAGKAVTGIGNIGSNLSQGYQQGRQQGGQQGSQQGSQQGGQQGGQEGSQPQVMQIIQQLSNLVTADPKLKAILGNYIKAMNDAMAQQQQQNGRMPTNLSSTGHMKDGGQIPFGTPKAASPPPLPPGDHYTI